MLLMVSALGFIACDDIKKDSNVKMVSSKDADMEKAILEAKKTMKDFIVALGKNDKQNYNFSVKIEFTDFGNTEHIWVDNLLYEGGILFGNIANTPKKIKDLKQGQKIKVEMEKATDWMYLRNDILQGGYTIRAIRNKMSAAEKAAFDKNLGFKIVD